MKLSKALVAASLAACIVIPVVSTANEYQQMPMMQGPYGQQPMMDPMMMQRMMQIRQQQMQQMQAPAVPHNTPVAQESAAVESIASISDKKHAGCEHHKGGTHNKQAMMKAMQGKQAMMQEHMSRVEAHLANIEALLQKMVDSR